MKLQKKTKLIEKIKEKKTKNKALFNWIVLWEKGYGKTPFF
jgi:hypothetical protein